METVENASAVPIAVRLMGTVFCTAFATVTGIARFGAVSATLVLQAERQSRNAGRAVATAARMDSFWSRWVISRLGRCEKSRPSAGPSETRTAAPDDFRTWFPLILQPGARFGHNSGSQAAGDSISHLLWFLRTPQQAFRRGTTRKASQKFWGDRKSTRLNS